MRSLRTYLWPIVILLLLQILFVSPLFRGVEHKAQDGLFRLRGPRAISDDLVVIAIDDASDSALDTRWPYPREYHAKLLHNLFLLGAKQVVFDVTFTESGLAESDALLADTAFYHQNTIFAGKVLAATRHGEPSRLLTPIKPLRERNLSWGLVNINPDFDNVIRQYTLYETHDDEPFYSIGIAALANSRVYQSEWDRHIMSQDAQLWVAGKKIPLLRKNTALINYYGPAGHFPYVSYASVLDDSSMVMPGYYGVELNEFYDLMDARVLEGKTVLIGATMDELHDKFPSPFGGDWTPGVEIHANFLEMVQREDYLIALPWLYYFLIELLLLLILWFVFRHLKPQFGAIILILLILAQYAGAYWLFSSRNLLIPIVQSASAFILIYVLSLILHYLASLKEKQFIRSTFQQYMAPELVNELLKNPKKLSYGGSYQEVSVLFSDIRSFTTYTESHTPAETVDILREYLTAMVGVITRNKGTLDKFVGDEIMALYGTPLPLGNHALHACKTALEMRDRLTELQEKWRGEGREIFEIGIGVNTGGAIVGNLGSEQIFDYTAIGDTINLGARLEAINKEYDTAKHIIISEFTYEKVKDFVEARYLDEVKVKGKNLAVKIYELLGTSL
jgi:adenylate cyclase